MTATNLILNISARKLYQRKKVSTTKIYLVIIKLYNFAMGHVSTQGHFKNSKI